MSEWKVYVIRCGSDGTLYCGSTTDVQRRFKEHQSGKGAKYTRGRGPLTLEAQFLSTGRSCAQKLEAKLKKLSRRDKEAIIASYKEIK